MFGAAGRDRGYEACEGFKKGAKVSVLRWIYARGNAPSIFRLRVLCVVEIGLISSISEGRCFCDTGVLEYR